MKRGRAMVAGLSGIVGLLLAANVAPAASTQERREKIQQTEQAATPAAVARKARSDALLLKEGVPVNAHLPAIEDVAQIKPRSRDEIAHRALALLAVSLKGEGLDQATVEKIVGDYGLTPHFTPAERAFIRNPEASDHERTQFVWRYEAAWVLLWALGYVDELGKPAAVCNVKRAVGIMRNRTSTQFLADAKPRPLAEIVEQADRIYRYHWAVVDARLKSEQVAGINADVIVERHHALNWLIRYMDAEWDDISTDT
jgi:hypothetical protein